MSARVAIILVNWNGWRDTIECLDSLLGQDHDNFDVFVVDNASSDGSLDHIAAWCARPVAEAGWRAFEGVRRWTATRGTRPIPCRTLAATQAPAEEPPPDCRITLIASEVNQGFAAGCNIGLRMSGIGRFNCFWLLNTDTVVHAGALSALLRRAATDPEIGMTGSTLRYYDEPQRVQAWGGAHLNERTAVATLIGLGTGIGQLPGAPTDTEARLSYIMGASLLVSAAFVHDIGPMRDDYFLYYEEIDWAWRGRRYYTLAWAPDSHVFHKSGASSSKVRPLFSTGCYYRSRMRFARRFLPERLTSVRRGLLHESLGHCLRARWGHARAAFDAMLLK